MKILLFILCFILICSNAFSEECYYVYIDRQSPVVNKKDGQNEKGDVLDVIKCNKITPPKHDFKNFSIIKMKLTKEEAEELKAPLLSDETDGVGDFLMLKTRKNKIDTTELTDAKEYTKDEILSKITVKSALSIDSD